MNQTFDVTKMRKHLHTCMKARRMDSFPKFSSSMPESYSSSRLPSQSVPLVGVSNELFSTPKKVNRVPPSAFTTPVRVLKLSRGRVRDELEDVMNLSEAEYESSLSSKKLKVDSNSKSVEEKAAKAEAARLLKIAKRWLCKGNGVWLDIDQEQTVLQEKMLDDMIISYVTDLLNEQRPPSRTWTIQDSTYIDAICNLPSSDIARYPSNEVFVQVIHDAPLHWVMVANIPTPSARLVYYYDSLGMNESRWKNKFHRDLDRANTRKNIINRTPLQSDGIPQGVSQPPASLPNAAQSLNYFSPLTTHQKLCDFLSVSREELDSII
jgi:hypothetical protein